MCECKAEQVKFGFTLAEVLITLGVIGVVAAMTLPSLISNYQTNALARKKTLFDNRLEEAMNQMRFHERLAGYTSAEDFVEELGNYLKINEVCASDELEQCFASTITSTSDDETTEFEVADLSTSADIATEDDSKVYDSENIGIIFADGVHAILNYQTNCEWLDPYESEVNRSDATNCISMIYDLNGRKGQNTVNSDIYLKNAMLNTGSDYVLLGFGDAWSTVDCRSSNSESDDYKNYCGTKPSNYSADSWAGANKACVGYGMSLPTLIELAEIASDIYGTTVTAYQAISSDITYNTTTASNTYGLPDPDTYNSSYTYFLLLSSEEHSYLSGYANLRGFYASSTGYGPYGCTKSSTTSYRGALCVK